MENLEQRCLLAADLLGWHNAILPTDVNADGVVATNDALLIARELYLYGARQLDAPSNPADLVMLSSSSEAAEGESVGRNYLDVNGDGCLTTVDALLVVAALRAEGQGEPLVEFRLETVDSGGTPVSTVEQGQSFMLNVWVRDLREEPGEPEYRGVSMAFLDVTFDETFVDAVGPVTHGDAYQEDTSGSLATPGLLDELGGVQTNYGIGLPFPGPLGTGEYLVCSVPFEATTVGQTTFVGDPADLATFHDVTLWDPAEAVPADQTIYGQTSIEVVEGMVVAVLDEYTVDEDSSDYFMDVLSNDVVKTGGDLNIVAVGPTDHGGTVVNYGSHLLYTPAANFVGTETFTYTIEESIDQVSDEGTVIVTVPNTNNDAPVAMDDGGVEYTTTEDTVFTTGNVLDNDTDIDGDTLYVSNLNKTGTLGNVTSNGDGTFSYDPNGQFDYLSFGQQATDTFTYTVSDGFGGSDTATVTITINGAAPATGNVTGEVYVDVNNNGVRDSVERAIGDVVVRLTGVDMNGAPVTRTAMTDAQGQFRFNTVSPGTYELVEVQPAFYLDGIDAVNDIPQPVLNDRVVITPGTDLQYLHVSFGERSLHPDFLSIGDAVNTALRESIVVGFDAEWNLLWYSLLDGWDDVTSVDVTFSEEGDMANLAVSGTSFKNTTFEVPVDPRLVQYRVMGETAEGRVVEFIGMMTDFEDRAAGIVAEGEGVADTSAVDAFFAGLDE